MCARVCVLVSVTADVTSVAWLSEGAADAGMRVV